MIAVYVLVDEDNTYDSDECFEDIEEAVRLTREGKTVSILDACSFAYLGDFDLEEYEASLNEEYMDEEDYYDD